MEGKHTHTEEHADLAHTGASSSRSATKFIVLGLVSTVVLAVLVCGAIVFFGVKKVSHNPTILKAANMLGMSAAEINGSKVSYNDYITDVETLKKFYAAQGSEFPPVSDQEISDMTLSRLIANNLIEQLANQYNVQVSENDVETKKQELLKSFQTQAQIEEQLQKNYGWSFDTYVQKVIRPLVREQKLQEAFSANTNPALNDFSKDEVRASHILFATKDKDAEAVKKQAEAVLARIKKGEDFAKLAKEFGSDGTKEFGGDLGWFGRGDMVKEFEDAAFAMQKGQVSELVKTEFGYHIVKLDDKRQGRDFIAFMDKQIADANIKIFIDVNNPFDKIKNKLANTPAPVQEGEIATTTAQ